MSNFEFMAEWPALQQHAQQAEGLVNADPRSSCFYSRYTLERAVHWMYEFDNGLATPGYDSTLNTLINLPAFREILGSRLFPKLKAVQKSGNNAVHSASPVAVTTATQTLKELHHVLYRFYRLYTRQQPPQDQQFATARLPQTVQIDARLVAQSTKRLKELQQKLEAQDKTTAQANADEIRKNKTLQAENAALRKQIEAQKAANAQAEDRHDYNEADTRHFLIDQYLKEVGWQLDQPRDREFPVQDMPISSVNPSGNGFIDYVLWGDDGQPLAVIEAKRSNISAESGKRQAELYADCLQKDPRFRGRRPLIYYTNGYETFFWDDSQYGARQVQGFLSKDEMQRLIDRRTEASPLADQTVNTAIAGHKRPYQILAIRSVCEQFEQKRARKSLLVMATGTGKTRTIIALVDILMRAGWIKNVLFLADRNALISQAKKEFSKLLPKVSAEILSGGSRPTGRLHLSTYPTMMNLLNAPADTRLFTVGHYDLVIVDEAHRSVYHKYSYIFDYFDALLVGLTATPKAELDKNTYDVFERPDDDPTFAYELQEAIDDRHLVPAKDVRVGLGFVREGIKYSELSDDEKAEWESKEDLQERDEVLPSEVNRFLFNRDTVEKALDILMEQGIKVAGGDRLAKTIIFAANNKHAEFICKVFNENFNTYKDKFARVITYKEKYSESLIEEFKGERESSDPAIPLTIAISVDMLDTGIDVPEVANLMFFKVIKSKVKFLQMLGRGTRLSPNLFGPHSPDDDKAFFKVFDCCQNFEYFEMQPEGVIDSVAKPVSQQIFESRLRLSALLQERLDDYDRSLRTYLLNLLHNRVSGMNLDNFIVRPKRQVVEQYLERKHWDSLNTEQQGELIDTIARLPTEAEPLDAIEQDQERALRFDQLILTMQLAYVEGTGISDKQQSRLAELAAQLEAKASVPAVGEHLEWIQYIQSANFWQDISLEELEQTRRKLRLLLRYLDNKGAGIVYTNFEDSVVEVQENDGMYTFGPTSDLALYRKRVEAYIREHENDLTIQRIKRNLPITRQDLEQLDTKLFEISGFQDKETYQETIRPEKPVGVFIRELVGLDRAAAKATFADFLDENRFNSQQIQFINTLIDYLTQNGVVNPTQLTQSPFIDQHSDGVIGLFSDVDTVLDIRGRIEQIQARAVGE